MEKIRLMKMFDIPYEEWNQKQLQIMYPGKEIYLSGQETNSSQELKNNASPA